MKNDRILLIHWGQTGAGPQLLLELAEAMIATVGADRVAISYCTTSSMADKLEKLPISKHSVQTYDRTTKSFLLNSPRSILLRFSLRAYIKREGIASVYSVMMNPYQSVATAKVFRNHFFNVATIHDGVPHAGDNALLGKTVFRIDEYSADHIITLSVHVKQQLITLYGIPEAKISALFHPAWNSSVSTPRELDRSRATRIGFFGRLLPYKGVNILLDALRQLTNEGISVEGHFYGDGPEKRLATDYQDVPTHWEARWIDDAEIPDILRTFDVLALPYEEASQSGVMAYALSAGIPVVGTPTGGLIEQISATRAGVLAQSISSPAIATAIKQLLDDRELFVQSSANGIAAASGGYSWESFALKLLPLLRS